MSGVCQPTCGSTSYVDCNGTTFNDGCETFLDELQACAMDCTGGVACASDQVCNAGDCVAPQGLAVFSIPFTAAGQAQRYGHRFPSDPMPDLTYADVVMRIYAPGATGGTLVAYVTDGSDFTGGPGISVTLASLATRWTDLRIAVGGAVGFFDPSLSYQVTIEVTASGSGPWANPTLIYVDAIWADNLRAREAFDQDSASMVPSTQQVVEGATLTWVDAMPEPTP